MSHDDQVDVVDDLVGKTYLVTGGNTGIGLVTARELAARGGTVHVACRSEEKGRAAVASIIAATGSEKVFFLPLDLADLASVRACATAYLALDQPLHCLINNAGVAGKKGITKDGFELTFGVNHLGHFLLTTLLLDRIIASAPARIVTVSSVGHYRAKGIDFAKVRRRTSSRTALPEYAVSKLANVLFTQELADRLAGTGVTTYTLHPGAVASDIWRHVPWPLRPILTSRMISTEEGARTTLYCATAPELAGVSGKYYDTCQEKAASAVATKELGQALWAQSEEWTRAT